MILIIQILVTSQLFLLMRLLRISCVVGMLASLFGISSILASTILCGPGMGGNRAWNSWAPDGSFSWYSNSLSDLGVSKVAGVFNYSPSLTRILVAIFSIGLIKPYVNGGSFEARGIIELVIIAIWMLWMGTIMVQFRPLKAHL